MNLTKVPTVVVPRGKGVWLLPDGTELVSLEDIPVWDMKTKDGKTFYQIEYEGALYWAEQLTQD